MSDQHTTDGSTTARNGAGTENARLLTDKEERKIRNRQTIRIAALVIVGGLLAVWVLVNRDDTQVDWLFTTTTSPLIVVMLVAALLGFIVGYFIARRRDSDE